MTTVTIEYPADHLHHRYPGQNRPQTCHVSLDCETGRLTADWDGETGGGVPFAVWHRRTLRWAVPALTAEASASLLERIESDAQVIVDGYEPVWDGNNHRGRFSDDAEEAIERIAAACESLFGDESATVQVWDASDFFGPLGREAAQCRELGITAETTDEELASIVEREESGAFPSIVDGCEKHLRGLRDWAQATAGELAD